MNRRRTPRPAAQAQALVTLAALPLVLTTSAVGVTQASATYTGESGPAPTTASLEAITADDLPERPDIGGLEAVPAAFQVPERPALGTPRAGDIPWGALQAYQRAADILREVQPSCGLSWTLIGAVGQVESEHGTVRGGELGDDGVVTPALLSRPLDGKGERPAVEDTDGGEVDGDDTWDHAVGPMQLLPGVWSLVGVDGDGDGTRSPQDVDDAALAAAVYLCAAGTDLADPEGAAEALAEYNGSEGYAEQVLAVEKRYAKRDFAVSGAPEPSTIGPSLGEGQGTQVRESERALREAKEQREQPETALTARRAEPAPTSEPKADPTTRPSPAAEPERDEEVVAAAPEPTLPKPGATEKAAGPSPAEPTKPAEPTETAEGSDALVVAGGITEGATDDARPDPDPADDPAVEPTEGANGRPDAGATEEPTGAGEADEPADPSGTPESGDPSTEGPADPTDQPVEGPAEEDGATGQGEAEDPAVPTDEAPTDEAPEQGEEPATGEGEGTEEPAADGTEEPAAEQTEDETAEEQETTTTALSGVLTTCGEGFCLDGTVLDLTAAGDLTADAGTDLDGDGATETIGDELTGLEGRSVELLVVEGSEPLLVVAVNGHAIVPE